MLYEVITQDNASPGPVQSPKETKVSHPTVAPQKDGIQILVTNKGQTKVYSDLKSVPVPVQHQIMNSWKPYLV